MGEFGLIYAVWVRFGSFPGKAEDRNLSETIRYQRIARYGLSPARRSSGIGPEDAPGTGPKRGGNGPISSLYSWALALGRAEEVFALERMIDIEGKDGRELRRVTKELVIRLWPLVETSCRAADQAWLARLKEWLAEVRTWPIDSSGLGFGGR